MTTQLSMPRAETEIPSERQAKQLALEYHLKDTQRRELGRQARSLEKEQQALGRQLVAYLEAHRDGRARECRLGKLKGFVLRLLAVQRAPSWKAEFERFASPGAAERLKADQPFVDRLEVVPF